VSILIEEVLDAWRRAERLLDGRSSGPDREELEQTIGQLRTLYADLTATSHVSARKLARATSVVERARLVLEEADRRLRGPGASSGG